VLFERVSHSHACCSIHDKDFAFLLFNNGCAPVWERVSVSTENFNVQVDVTGSAYSLGRACALGGFSG